MWEKEQSKPKEGRKEIIKKRTEINGIETYNIENQQSKVGSLKTVI